jgi:hypothetical protein
LEEDQARCIWTKEERNETTSSSIEEYWAGNRIGKGSAERFEAVDVKSSARHTGCDH